MTNHPDITLYGGALSGHSHRVELLLHLLRLPHRFVEVTASERRGAWFRSMNPLARIPVLKDGGTALADSNAILSYLALRHDAARQWAPTDPAAAARVQRWLSVAAGEVMHGPATARLIALFGAPLDLVRARAIAARRLAFMDGHLAGRSFLAAARPTVADLACYSYVAHAPEGGVSLDPHPAVRACLSRIEALPGFRAMPRSALPVA